MKKLVFVSMLVGLITIPVFAGNGYVYNLNNQIQNNIQLIRQYEDAVARLKKRNEFLLQQKKSHPLLYKELPAFSATKKAYIYRIMLNGAKPQNINFKINNGMLSLSMDMQQKQKSQNSFFESSRYFYQSFTLPKNINIEGITHKIVGDYFVITIPKKAA